jgi:hypothetical protein
MVNHCIPPRFLHHNLHRVEVIERNAKLDDAKNRNDQDQESNSPLNGYRSFIPSASLNHQSVLTNAFGTNDVGKADVMLDHGIIGLVFSVADTLTR